MVLQPLTEMQFEIPIYPTPHLFPAAHAFVSAGQIWAFFLISWGVGRIISCVLISGAGAASPVFGLQVTAPVSTSSRGWLSSAAPNRFNGLRGTKPAWAKLLSLLDMEFSSKAKRKWLIDRPTE